MGEDDDDLWRKIKFGKKFDYFLFLQSSQAQNCLPDLIALNCVEIILFSDANRTTEFNSRWGRGIRYFGCSTAE